MQVFFLLLEGGIKKLIDFRKSKSNNILLIYKRTVKPGKKEYCPLFSFYKERLGKKV